MRAVLDEGLMIGADQLKVDVDGTRNSVVQGSSEAFALSLSIAYPTKENIDALLQTAHQKAFALSLGAAVPTKENIGDLIRKANSEMTSLNKAVEKVTPKS